VWEYEVFRIGDRQFGKVAGPRFGWIGKVFGYTREACSACSSGDALKLAACCASCGDPIFPGVPVAIMVYSAPTTEILPYLAYATHPTDNKNAFVLCMDCSPGTVCMTGYWTGTGVRPPNQSPMELLLSGSAQAVMVDGEGRIIVLE
jgi:hypothetical protein